MRLTPTTMVFILLALSATKRKRKTKDPSTVEPPQSATSLQQPEFFCPTPACIHTLSLAQMETPIQYLPKYSG